MRRQVQQERYLLARLCLACKPLPPLIHSGIQDDDKETLYDDKSNACDNKEKAQAEVENVSSTDDEHHAHSQNEQELFYPILFAPTQVWRSESRDATKTYLLQVLRRYQSLVVDVIFSLLIGRTVIIQGSEKNKR